MRKNLFENMDALIKKAGSANPHELLDYLHIKQVPLYSSVLGYIVRYKNMLSVGWNVTMPENDQLFTLMHECTHAVEHIPAGILSPLHQEIALFTLDKNIAIEEKEANLCAAEYTIPTEDVLELTGYYSRTVQEYCELKQEIGQLSVSGTVSAKALRCIYEDLENLEAEIAADHSICTYKEIARTLGFRESFIAYKIEALRLRGYNIPELELPDAQKTFGLNA